MGSASQAVIDAAAQAIAQETLDRRHSWRQMFAVKHGLPDVERNIIKISEPAYYDRVVEAPVQVENSSLTVEELRNLIPRIQEPRIQEPRIQEPKIQESKIQESKIEAPKIQESSVLKKTLIGLASAGAIGASGLAGYYFNKQPPTVTTAPVDGDLLQELRKRGYHLRRTE